MQRLRTENVRPNVCRQTLYRWKKQREALERTTTRFGKHMRRKIVEGKFAFLEKLLYDKYMKRFNNHEEITKAVIQADALEFKRMIMDR